MFDIGFPELLTTFVIALVVLGPARMQGMVTKVGRWVGKARSMAREFRNQLENEVNLEDLNKMTEKQTKQARTERAAMTPVIPPELTGEPVTPQPLVDPSASANAESYPYEAPPAPIADAQATESHAAESAAQPGDDTYSHAHAHGDAPMPYVPDSDVPDSYDYRPAGPAVIAEVVADDPQTVADAHGTKSPA